MLHSLKAALPGLDWLDVEEALCELRSQKSPSEIEVIRYAYRIAEVGFQAGVDAIRAGISEREVAAEIESAMRHAGSEGTGIDTIVASGPNTRPILARSTFRRIVPTAARAGPHSLPRSSPWPSTSRIVSKRWILACRRSSGSSARDRS